MYIAPRPNRGRARGRLNAGTAAGVVAEMRHQALRGQAGEVRRGWCGGHDGWHASLVMAVQAVGSRRAGCAPRDRTAGAFAASYRVRIGQVPQRWIGAGLQANVKRRRRLKSLTTGGPTEQASNTARGTPEKRRTCGAVGKGRQHRAERPTRPVRDRAALKPRGFEARGSDVDPASRAPSLVPRASDEGPEYGGTRRPLKQYGRWRSADDQIG